MKKINTEKFEVKGQPEEVKSPEAGPKNDNNEYE
jgi:hypothetical protein